MTEAERREGTWQLPELSEKTDRLVVFQQTREDDRVHRHFVAFRKDSEGAWWLLDSRNPGEGKPRREKISPQDYASRLGDALQSFTLIGAGVIGGLEVKPNL